MNPDDFRHLRRVVIPKEQKTQGLTIRCSGLPSAAAELKRLRTP